MVHELSGIRQENPIQTILTIIKLRLTLSVNEAAADFFVGGSVCRYTGLQV